MSIMHTTNDANIKAKVKTDLFKRNASCEKFNHISGFDQNVRIPRLSSRSDGHTTFDRIEIASQALQDESISQLYELSSYRLSFRPRRGFALLTKKMIDEGSCSEYENKAIAGFDCRLMRFFRLSRPTSFMKSISNIACAGRLESPFPRRC